MKKTLYIALLAAGLLAAPALPAAEQYKTFDEAVAKVTDDGYILFVYAEGWDRFSEPLCKKLIADPAITEAAGNAALILAPFYQYAGPEDKSKQQAVWGGLVEPRANSMETYPSLLMYDKNGYLYGRVQGSVVTRGTPEEVAAEVKAKLEAKHKQDEIMKKAEAASGTEAAVLISEACQIAGIEKPQDHLGKIKAVDPGDQSGMVKRHTFDYWGFSQKYCGKKSDGGLQMEADDVVREMKKFIDDPAYTNEQKQAFYAVIMGTLRRSNASANAIQIRSYAAEMKKLAPESHLGVSADEFIKVWVPTGNKK